MESSIQKTRPELQYSLHFASHSDSLAEVLGEIKSKHRSGCPVSIALEAFGDRWSLLIIRDLMVRGYRTFKEFQQSGEGIATKRRARPRKTSTTCCASAAPIGRISSTTSGATS